MIDPVSAARNARENLAQGLAALQIPGVPQQLTDVAEPVAEAMSALHRIESTHGAALTEAGPVALAAVRRALGMLQPQAGSHSAVDQAVEAVASSLGLVHRLTQHVPAVPPVAVVQPAAPRPGTRGPGGTVVLDDDPANARPPQAPAAQFSQQPFALQPQRPQPQQPAPEPQPQQPAPEPQPQQPAPEPQPQQPAPVAAAAVPWGQQPAPWEQQAAPAPVQPAPPEPAARPAAPVAGPGAPLHMDAALGAHSATNFYKGLSGNDVIDSGGIFVATYQIPEIGQDLIIKVSLPGGYEFEAHAVVRWTRDAPNSGAESSPGFGAQFTQILPEGRQLVYRYVRNREPLFYDDL